jgi:DNA-binding transcriptional MerR regulator
MDLLRKKDVVKAVGAAKSTVADWIEEFADFIETVKEGNATFYKPSAIKVLREIKELRAQDVPKTAIAEVLVRRGFAINSEKVKTKIENATEVATAYQEMTPTTEIMVQIMSQMSRQDGRMTEMQSEMASLKSEVAAAMENEARALDELKRMEERIKALEEDKSKGFFGRLFGK